MRIMVVGSGGAGKSTIARTLGRRTGLPVVHLDALYWQPGWNEPSQEHWRSVQRAAFAGNDWIADGNYGGTLDERLPHADLVVFLDYARWRCLLRLLKRTARSWHRVRPDMAPGCPEHLDLGFLRYVATFPERHRPRLLEQIARHGKAPALVGLRTPRETKRWLRTFG